MNAFHFPLQKVLEWRRTQLDLEEIQLRRQRSVLGTLDARRAQLDASGSDAERQIRGWSPVAAGELEALGGFRLRVKDQQREMADARVECIQQLDRQEARMLEARRRLRLLERLKERRQAEWRAARDKELEELATESYLAKWQRQNRAGGVTAESARDSTL
jgi:flagellar export protein FliJ